MLEVKQEDLTAFFFGEKLYGDDFSPDEIAEWFEDEREGYAELEAKSGDPYQYVYHALNALHGFRYLPDGPFQQVLGFGGAFGDEFQPLAHRIHRVTIVDPSDAFVRDEVCGIPATYVKPSIDGTLPFPDHTFDLITCLGVLHHIPNVSYVVTELYRCLQPGGTALIREPVISMGDWRQPRPGLTRRERGIPLPIFREMVEDAGFKIQVERLCMFPLIRIAGTVVGRPVYNSTFVTRVDMLLSKMLAWNLRYHATSAIQKFRPSNVYWVLSK